ncbi:MAG: helix-turn-helix transcriptional regulator [Bacteroidetes bacterium]|nr:helix-turn-helix transcriptional regulator [Bacteroidota bacterium]MCL2303114.1 helix-turn-helix transcriptional regulator [Lentimicrobiaceae bacterium]
MKKNDSLKDLHIGRIIKEIALQKGISSKKIAALIHRDQKNADKIFRINDMDVEDIVCISYLLECNILELIAKKYLSHLSCSHNFDSAELCLLKIDMRNRRVITDGAGNHYNFLKEIYIGQHIRELAKKNGWSQQDIAKQLHCAQNSVSDLYKRKSLKIKKLIRISDALQYHFIAELYLSQMMINSSFNKIDHCIITIHSQQIRIVNPNDKTNVMVFRRYDDKK